MTKRHLVRLSPDLVAKCKAWPAEMVAHHRSGNPLQAMPWTHNKITLVEFEQWVARRAEAGRAIDIETCELGRWPAYDADPYGLQDRRGDLPEEMKQVGTNRFVRSPDSGGWVSPHPP